MGNDDHGQKPAAGRGGEYQPDSTAVVELRLTEKVIRSCGCGRGRPPWHGAGAPCGSHSDRVLKVWLNELELEAGLEVNEQ